MGWNGGSMARKVKCFATKESGMSDSFFKAPNGKYFKNEDVYKAWVAGKNAKTTKPKKEKLSEEEKENRAKIIDELSDIIGYKKGQPFPTVMTRKLKDLSFYTNEVILETVRKSRQSILWAFQTKNFETDYQKISYMMGIIRNRLPEVSRDIENRKKAELSIEKAKTINVEDIESVNKKEAKIKDDVSDLIGGDLWT